MAITTDPVDAHPQARPGAGSLREVVMGAQDNLTNVLAVVLGVAIGSGEVSTVALAGLAAGVAEAISMGGVLYTATRAERDLAASAGKPFAKRPVRAAATTFVAAFVAALVPLAPFAFLSLGWAMVTAAVLSLTALFGVGIWTGGITGDSWWRSGARFVTIGGLAALASALVGVVLKTNGAV
ncbi:MAG TPA: VIT1/CCC1 transporter family protein [Actinomycetota bacterium]